MQQRGVGETIGTKMEQLRLTYERDLHIQQHTIDAATISFRQSLDSTKTLAHQTLQFHGILSTVSKLHYYDLFYSLYSLFLSFLNDVQASFRDP